MDVHKNARLTPHCRGLLIERVQRGQSKESVAQLFAVSVRTVNKWLHRYQAEGVRGLEDRSSRPRRCPTMKAKELEVAVVALRRHRLTLLAIAQQLELSRATVARICGRVGLQRLTKLDPPQVVVRYERAQPGELLHWISRN